MAEKSGLKSDVEVFLTKAINENMERCNKECERFKKENAESYIEASRKDRELIKELQATRSRLATQLDKFENRTHREMSYNMDLQFLEANCDKPLLWVCGDPAMHNSGSFGRIMDKLRKLCPRVEMVVFTPNGTQIQEMDDEDLFKVGLLRFKRELLTPETIKLLKGVTYKLPESRLTDWEEL